MVGHSWYFRAALAVAMAPFLVSGAKAQGLDSSAARIRAKLAAGDRVTIVSADGGFSSGRLIGVSADSLVVRSDRGASEIALQEVTEVRKHGDSPWNGFLVGGALGAALGFAIYTDCEPVAPYRTCEGNMTTSRGMEAATAGALFAALGLTVDLLMDRPTTVYRASARRRGLSVMATPRRVQAGYRIGF